MSEDQSGTLQPWLTHIGAFMLGRLTAPEKTPGKLLKADGLAYLIRVVKEWRPVNCQSEAECHLALHNYLLGRFSQDRLLVDTQYGSATSRVDLVVEHDYAIELKFGLNRENEINRLKGQVDNLRQHFKGVLVVLCGPLSEEVQIRLERDLGLLDDRGQPVSAVLAVPVVQRQLPRATS